MPILYRSLKTIKDYKNGKYYQPVNIVRSSIKIAVIDNDGFPTEEMAKTGFSNITSLKTYDGIEPFDAFDIILCDMDGVGKSIDAKGQGAAVAKTLKENYPNKLVYIYSGRQPEEFDRTYYKYCDSFIPKDQSLGEIASFLSTECGKIKNPVDLWERYAKYLYENQGLSSKIIAYLEDAYVRSLEEKKSKISDSFSRKLGIALSIIKTITDMLALFLG